jgi:hypothetical protein
MRSLHVPRATFSAQHSHRRHRNATPPINSQPKPFLSSPRQFYLPEPVRRTRDGVCQMQWRDREGGLKVVLEGKEEGGEDEDGPGFGRALYWESSSDESEGGRAEDHEAFMFDAEGQACLELGTIGSALEKKP